MTIFRVTLNFTFTPHTWDENEYENKKMNNDQLKIKKKAFNRTDAYYIDNDIEDYIMNFDAMEMVQYLFDDGYFDVLSAEWNDSGKFAIHVVVHTEEKKEKLTDWLKNHSLEDGEYEGCSEEAWGLYTRGPNGEVYDGKNYEDVWVYGITDYRKNPIHIEEMPTDKSIQNLYHKLKDENERIDFELERANKRIEELELKFSSLQVELEAAMKRINTLSSSSQVCDTEV